MCFYLNIQFLGFNIVSYKYVFFSFSYKYSFFCVFLLCLYIWFSVYFLRPSLQLLYRYIILVSYKVFSISYIVYIVLVVVIGKDEPFSRFLHIHFVNFLSFLDFFCVLPFFQAVVIKSVLTSFFLYV